LADRDEPQPDVTPFRPRPKPKSEEARADAQWELMARREARIGRLAPKSSSRIPNRVRWWIAAFLIVALVVLFRERLPWLG
jgi:hypothetical protein